MREKIHPKEQEMMEQRRADEARALDKEALRKKLAESAKKVRGKQEAAAALESLDKIQLEALRQKLAGIEEGDVPSKETGEFIKEFAPGEEVKVRRSNGKIEEGWVIAKGKNETGFFQVAKQFGEKLFTKNISAEELSKYN